MRTELALVAVALASAPAVADADSCVPGFDYAIFAKDGIHIQGNAGTDSWNSANGSYASTNACDNADIGTNSSTAGAVYVQGASSTICGDGKSGAGSSPGSVFSGNGSITGTTSAQTTNQSLPNVTVPTLSNASPFNLSYQNTHAVLAPDKAYGAVSCKKGSLTLSAGKYVVQSLTLTTHCEIRVTSGPIEVYFTDFLDAQAGVVVNTTDVPGNLVFYGGPSATSVHLQGGVDSYFAVYAPTAQCHLQGNVDMYGAIVCDDAHVQGNAQIHYDVALSTLAGGGFTCNATEISRATPIVTTLDNERVIVQGTYERPTGTPKTIVTTADVAKFWFPYLKGHMRARTADSISTTGSAFSTGTVLFDAGASGKIPSPNYSGCNSFDGTCRNVFTVTQTPASDGTSFHPPRVQLNDGNSSTIGALMAPASVVSGITATHWKTIVRTVLAGNLGGVDRSTVAVIPASPLAGLSTRPTIAYFGATDGMIHAVCASTGGTTESGSNICPSVGTELWAFMPRVQLPLVRVNKTRVDGSVRVVDAFGDFNSPATGTRSFRTILTFQTGYADTTYGAEAAVYALDVTDPADPVVLWEYTKPSSPGSTELGVGLALSVGPTLVDGKPTNLVVAQTSNGGTGGSGVVATALSLETGTRAWQFGHVYPSPARGVSADGVPPTSGIPGGAVGVDLTRLGYTTDIVMGDLYGNLWRLDAATGTSRTGTGVPLFRFSTNKHPIGVVPAIYGDGSGAQYAVFTTGGYAHPVSTAWSAGTQKLISIDVQAAGPYPIAETSTAKLAVVEDLGSGERGFAQVLVIGTELFVTTDNTDINSSSFGTGGDTGHVLNYDLAEATSSTVVVRGGAGSLAHDGTTLFSSSSDHQQQLSSNAQSTTGTSVDSQLVAKLGRMLWLRTQ